MSRLRIALITPWPPDYSGIADFSRDLAIGLAEAGVIVDVFTHASHPIAVEGVRATTVSAEWNGSELTNYPIRLFQLGNNLHFHRWMLHALQRFPGVVQLHDIVLHHFVAGITCAQNQWDLYLRAFESWYGRDATARARAPLDHAGKPVWETDAVIDYPFYEFFVKDAKAVIVHSKHAAVHIAERLPQLPLLQVHQTYRHSSIGKRSGLRRIGIFGGVHENKRLEWIFEAFAYLDSSLKHVEITIVGAIAEQSEFLIEKSKLLPHAKIQFLGRVTEDSFRAAMEQTDLCISLRHPTMGETSAIVMRALQMGIPTIVSDTGWYAELPAEVLKAPLDNTPHYLASNLHRLLTQPDQFASWAGQCADLPDRIGLSHTTTCSDIISFLKSHRAERFANDIVADKLVNMGFIGDTSELAVLYTIESRLRLGNLLR